ncbi:hypothetical protein AAG906_021883 [Vitis piasezkii]
MKWKAKRENHHGERCQSLDHSRSGKQIEKPKPKSHAEKEEEVKKGKEMEDKESEITEEKKDSDSKMKAMPEKELLKEGMLKKSTNPPFPQALHGKKGIKMQLKSLNKCYFTCKSPLKYKDPGSPTISVMIGGKVVEKALLDLGASVNLLPYTVYKQLGLGELKPTAITLSLADRSVKIPRGEANLVPIILGRPFLATSNAIINCRNGLMQLTFGNMTLDLNIFYMSKKQITPEEEEEGPEEVCIIDTLVEEHCNQTMQDKLNESLVDFEEDQEKTTFTCPFGTFAYRRMPFGLCNAPATFQRCMLSIFSDMVERIMEVFMDDITVYGGIEVDKAKVELIVKLPSPTTVKGVRQFLGHAGFYRRCQHSFDQLKKFLTTTPIVRAPNWQLPFELMCDASDFAIGAVLGQREDGKPYVIYYASKTLNEAQRNYTTTEKELLAVHFFAKIHAYYWEEPFLFKYCADQIIRKCVPEDEQQGILSHCHENACGGHFASQKTAMKVLQSGFTWPSLFKDAHIMCRNCDRCQRLGKLTKRNQMPMNPILIVELFDVWGIDFMGPFPMSFGNSYILVGIDYVSKWVEAIP